MTLDHIDYAARMHKSLLGIVRDLLIDTARDGLPGDHHFYLSFDTNHPDVIMPVHLKERHPTAMTVVIQHQYWDLTITEDYFSVQLSFNGNQESLTIPFEALTSFVDPSVQFGLPLQDGAPTKDIIDVASMTPTLDPVDPVDDPEPEATSEPEAEEGDEVEKDNVITLDQFRKT